MLYTGSNQELDNRKYIKVTKILTTKRVHLITKLELTTASSRDLGLIKKTSPFSIKK